METDFYFEPINLEGYEFAEKPLHKRMGDVVRSYHSKGEFPDLEDVDIALIGVQEDRNAISNRGSADAADQIRKHFYKLFQGEDVRLADLGNIRAGNNINDTYYALTEAMAELLKHDIFPVVLGGSQDLSYSMYKAYEKIGQIINIVAVDPLFDLGEKDEELSSQSYLSKIILHQPNYLFNYTNLGYQTYYVDQEAIELMNNLFFDCYRLGQVRSDLSEAEPLLRNADMLTFDFSAIRASDAPANKNACPNGFYGEEACQILRYAGMSDKLTALGLFEMNPQEDRNGQTASLASQMLWYFIEGFYNRLNDIPYKYKNDFLKYTVTIQDHKEQIVFFKSKKSDRWWMEVPVKASIRTKYERHHFIPCSYKDYQTALKDEIPDRWWQAYQKLM